MAFTKTQIANRALVKLGARPITNLEDDNTDESITVLNLYDIALESLLSETLWTFATKRVLLAELTDTIAFSRVGETLSYVYQRPNDAIRIFEASDVAATWFEEGDTVVSDTAGLGVRYTYRNENTAVYTPHFVEALSDKLASELAYPLLNSRSKTDDLVMLYEKTSLPKAKSQNAQVGTAKELNDNFFLNARYGGPNIKEFS